MFRDKQAKVLIFLVCMILGIMLATQFKSAENAKNSISQQRVEDLAERLKTAEKDKANLTEEIKKLHKQSGGDAMALELTALRARAGETAMEGPGVKVTLDDSTVVTKPGDNANLYIIHDIMKFYNYLDEVVDLIAEQLYHRFKVQANLKVRDLPFLMGQGLYLGSEKLAMDDNIESAIINGTVSLGFIGLAETLTALIGHHHVVRKLAHFTEFALQGFLIYKSLSMFRVRNGVKIAIIIGILTAIIDETIQLSVPGRSSQISDVILDTAGAATGACISYLFALKHK